MIKRIGLYLALMPLGVACTTIEQDSAKENSLLKPWTDVYQGVPNFHNMKLEDLEPALDQVTREHLAEIEVIASNPADPTFSNTIVALESAGSKLDKVFAYYGVWSANLSTPEFRKAQARLAPKMAAYRSKINQNEALFARIKAIYDAKDNLKLKPDEHRLVYLVYNGFARNGAMLQGKAKKRYAEISKDLSELYVKFGNNVLADEENYVLYLTDDELDGLPSSYIKAAAAAAAARGQKGKYAITNTRSSMDPFLTYSERRNLREKVWKAYYNRGDNGDEYDNNEIIAKILKLRHERVQLLGYKNYAEWRLENRMAQRPEDAEALLLKVWPAATARVRQEVKDMQSISDRLGGSFKLQPWDYRYFSEKVRQERYNFNSNQVKEYLELNNLREAMFYVAGRLFDFTFIPVPEGLVPTFHEDVRVWEVKRQSTGEHIGLWYLDPFARKGKRSGAWATSYRSHTSYKGKTNVLSANNSNFVKPAPGEAVLVSWDDAQTFFHEFGHALHSLASNVTYPSLNGGVRDYTEFQSQLLERWLMTDEVINKYLRHYKTNTPMPKTLVEKIKKASNFNQGFKTTEYLASAIIDLKLHSRDPEGIDPGHFEAETLRKINMPEELVMRHRTPHFGHVFSGEGYAAGYYGYIWAEVLTSDAAEAFAAAPGGFYDQELGGKLVKYLFAPRNSMDPNEAYRAFRGAAPRPEALMRDRGFTTH